MKKIFLALLLAVLAVGCAPKLTFYEALPYNGTRPAVDSIVFLTYQTKQDAGGKWVKNSKDHERFTLVFTKKGVMDSTKYHNVLARDKKQTEHTITDFDIKKGNFRRIATTRTGWDKPRHTLWEQVGEEKNEGIYLFHNSYNSIDSARVSYDAKTATRTSTTKDHRGDLKVEKTTYKNYLIQQTVVTINGKPSLTQEFEYDQDGLLTKETITEGSDKPYIIKYTYHNNDQHGNWTLQNTYLRTDKNLSTITERKLIYRK